MTKWIGILMVLLIGATMGCGSEATDRPSDCRVNEYFDDGRRQCRTCPAVLEPTCRPGCDTVMERDQRDCPVLRCEPICQGCDQGERWDDEAESCVPDEAEDEQ